MNSLLPIEILHVIIPFYYKSSQKCHPEQRVSTTKIRDSSVATTAPSECHSVFETSSNLKRCIIDFLSAFDGRTTALLVAIAFFIQANAIGAQAYLIREYKGVGTALLGNLSMAIGFTLLLLRTNLSDFTTIVIANSLVLISPNLYYIAVGGFSGQRYSQSLVLAIITINTFLLVFFTYVSENVSARSMSVSIFGAFSTFLAVNQLWNLRLTIYKFSVALLQFHWEFTEFS